MSGTLDMDKFVVTNYVILHILLHPLWCSIIHTDIVSHDAMQLIYFVISHTIIQIFSNGWAFIIFNLFESNNLFVQGPLTINPLVCDKHIGKILNGYPSISCKRDFLASATKNLLHLGIFFSTHLHVVLHYHGPWRHG